MRYFKSLCFILLLMPVMLAAAPTIPDDKAVITFENKKGTVTFNHSLHATVRSIQCQSCHHTLKEGEPVKPCDECHKAKDSPVEGFSVLAPKESKAYHTRCKGCHQYTLEELHLPAGPTKCALCHIKAE